MNILIIDDDKATIHALKHYLQEHGHIVTVASDGESAISEASARPFDLIISDIMMPGISGLSLVNVLRSVHLSTTPIIMMSSLVNQPLLDAAFEAGANDFISKPVDPEDLDNKLRKFDPTISETR